MFLFLFFFFTGDLGGSVSSEPYKVTNPSFVIVTCETTKSFQLVLYKVLIMFSLSFISVQL